MIIIRQFDPTSTKAHAKSPSDRNKNSVKAVLNKIINSSFIYLPSIRKVCVSSLAKYLCQ